MAEENTGTLSPPVPEHHALDDPGAHELEPDSDDQFHDAKSETRSRSHSRPVSPIPITRVERVDHEASYGEVPGTEAYEKRAEDARPDEVAFIEEEEKTESPGVMSPTTPGGQPIPKTVLEEVPPSPVLGGLSRSSTHKHKRHMSDAMPDLILHVEDRGDVTPPVKSPDNLTPNAISSGTSQAQGPTDTTAPRP